MHMGVLDVLSPQNRCSQLRSRQFVKLLTGSGSASYTSSILIPRV